MYHVSFDQFVQVRLEAWIWNLGADNSVDVAGRTWLVFIGDDQQYMGVWQPTLLELHHPCIGHGTPEHINFCQTMEETA